MLAPARAVQVTVTDDTLAIDLEDGRSIAVPIGWYPRLAYGAAEERANFQISGAGYGIHWRDLDHQLQQYDQQTPHPLPAVTPQR